MLTSGLIKLLFKPQTMSIHNFLSFIHSVFFFPLTVMGHSQRQALLEATVLALVTILLLNLAGALTTLIFQFHPHSAPEKALSKKHHNWFSNSSWQMQNY